MMGLLIDLFRQIRTWEKSAKLALVLALMLLVILVAMAMNAPDDFRHLMWFSVAALVLVVQFVVLWGNRTMIAPYTQARRQFMAGDFVGARDTLRAYLDEREQPSVDALVLLGNTYRNLGQLEDSEAILRKALAMKPSCYFVLYGLGRTLLVRGDYPGAAALIDRALQSGAPSAVLFDLGHAQYRMQDRRAQETLRQIIVSLPEETHRQLMAHWWLHQMDGIEKPDAALIAVGLPFWMAETERFNRTPYGQALQRDVQALRSLSQER